MSESAKPLSIGIHELLRYAMHGYSFLFLLFLPFTLTGTFDLLFPRWDLLVPLFLIGGLVIGYLLYYPYYFYFRTQRYTCVNRKSLQLAKRLTGKNSVDAETLAIHSLAISKEDKKSN